MKIIKKQHVREWVESYCVFFPLMVVWFYSTSRRFAEFIMRHDACIELCIGLYMRDRND